MIQASPQETELYVRQRFDGAASLREVRRSILE